MEGGKVRYEALSELLPSVIIAGLLTFLMLVAGGCRQSPAETATGAARASATAPNHEATTIPATALANTPVLATATRGPLKATTPASTLSPNNTVIPVTATPQPEQEPVDDFGALYQLLPTLDDGTQIGEILDALAASEIACLRGEGKWLDDENVIKRPALDLAVRPNLSAGPCIDPGREADIKVALIARAAGGLSAEAESCIRDEVIEGRSDDLITVLLFQPLYMNCLNEEQFLEISVSELAGQAGGVDDDTRKCLRQVISGSFGAAERLRSGNPQDSMAIALTFREAAIYGCLSDEQAASITGADVAASVPSTDCLRHLYTQQFPRLYSDIGPGMFGSRLDLSPGELEAIEVFRDRVIECRDDPATAYPTPDAPAPTLRPALAAGLRSILDADSTVEDVIASLGNDGAACLRAELFPGWDWDEAGYKRFLSLPAVALTGIPLTLEDCFGSRAADILTSIVVKPAGGVSVDVQTCFRREFAGTGDNSELVPPSKPRWRLTPAYYRCLTDENYQNLAIAQLTAYVGELSGNSENCAREIASQGYNIAKETDEEDFQPFDLLAHILCLSDDHFVKLYPPPQPGLEDRWPPVDRDCVRTLYDQAVTRLQIEISDPDWDESESAALDGLYADNESCLLKP